MNNPNPFVPKGSLLEQQSKRRSRAKIGVFCVLVVSITGLMAMLIQGCKREQADNNAANNPVDTSMPPVDTNTYAVDTNPPPPVEPSNLPPILPPVVSNATPAVVPTPMPAPTPMATPTPVPAAAEYVVVKGDTLGKIARKEGVSLRALENANPSIVPTRLQIGQKLTIPATAGGGSVPAPTAMSAQSGGGSSDENVYTVKSGDTLSRIARHFGTTVKAIRNENNLTTTMIRVGQKLRIPSKAEPAVPAPAPAPVTTTSAPATTPDTGTPASDGQQ
jgi:LysM repeat protein